MINMVLGIVKLFKSGWWYGVCYKVSFNGFYFNGSDKDLVYFVFGIIWYIWKGYDYFLIKLEMKICFWKYEVIFLLLLLKRK